MSLSGGTIKLSQRVYFKHNRDTIQKSGYPLLLAVATLMKAKPDIRRVEVARPHRDDRGVADSQLDLSDRRAKSVMRFLVEQWVDGSRLVARGYGDTQPVASNKINKGRTKTGAWCLSSSTVNGRRHGTCGGSSACERRSKPRCRPKPQHQRPRRTSRRCPPKTTAPTSPPVIDLTAKLCSGGRKAGAPSPRCSKKGKRAGAALLCQSRSSAKVPRRNRSPPR